KTLLHGSEPKAAKPLPGIDEVTAEATQLYGELQQADAAPTAALLEASHHVESEGKEALPGWEEFKQKELPALNTVLKSGHRPAVDLNKPPDNMPEQGDED
ncbi:MAG TPA: hypothetical protein VGI45_26855, partial [Terracidiphilus sp.]